MDAKDIFGLGKVFPMEKLLDVVSSATGRIFKTFFYKKDAKAKAFEMKELAKARAEEIKIMSKAISEHHRITGGITYEDGGLVIRSPMGSLLPAPKTEPAELPGLAERAQERINHQEMKKQANLESITSFAAGALVNEDAVTAEPLDEDWKTRFFSISEDISNEDMQALWGQILADEIKRPKSYSLRTLETLKNLTQPEAECFTKFCQAKLVDENIHFLYNADKGDTLEKLFGITFDDTLLMAELGLISSKSNITVNYDGPVKESKTEHIFYGSVMVNISRNVGAPKKSFEALNFTETGKELSKLIHINFNETYLKRFLKEFMNAKVDITYGPYSDDGNGGYTMHNAKDFK